jgi:hypothetical protein
VINIGPKGTGLAGFIDYIEGMRFIRALAVGMAHDQGQCTVCFLRGMVGAMARSQQFTCPEFEAADLSILSESLLLLRHT